MKVLLLPVASAAVLAGYGILHLGQPWPLVATFFAASALLLAWTGAVLLHARSSGRNLSLEVAVRTPHYVQMFAQGSVLLYWGWWVRSVYAYAPYIVAQIVFAYGVDALLNWSRRDRYLVGVGPFPVIFSISLFLWFRLEVFYWQLAMVALVFFGKEFLRWDRDGRSRHIFNPSAFALAVAAFLIIVTGSTDITFGQEIATTQANPPHIYLAIFLASLPGQILFGVTTMTVSAVVTVYLFGLVFFGLTGTYFFYDSYIPIAVFLGMHLLFTDPATSPRSESGRVIFGALYGLLIVAFAAILSRFGVPEFWDKLLPVPILNLMVRRIDAWMASGAVKLPNPLAFAGNLSAAGHRYAVVAIWATTFAGLSAVDGVGDWHRGQFLPFWAETCAKGNDRACRYMTSMQANYCNRDSGWACNELGVYLATRRPGGADAAEMLQRACALGFGPGCQNRDAVAAGALGSLTRAPPPDAELPVLLRGSKGPVQDTDPQALRALACRQGWAGACDGAAQ